MPSSSVVFESCPICGGRISLVTSNREVRIGKRSVSVRAELPTCSKCGEVYLSPDEADQLQRRAATAIREQDNLMSPERIRRLRQKLGLTQTQLEKLLGTGAKTVVRWERGTVFQNVATDSLLRVLAHCPQAVHFLAQLRGVRVTPFSRKPSRQR